MPNDTDQHTEGHEHHHAHKKQSSRFLLLAVPFLLILILLTVAVSLGTKKSSDLEQYPVEEVWEDEEGVEEEAAMEDPGQFVGEPANSIIVTDKKDINWVNYHPFSISTKKVNASTLRVFIYGTPQLNPPINMMVIGYSNKTFNPVEEWSKEGTRTSQIQWVAYQDSNVLSKEKIIADLKINLLPTGTKDVYFYIYTRVNLNSTQTATFIYGDAGNFLPPYHVSI